MFKILQQSFKSAPPVQWTLPPDMTLEQARTTILGLLAEENVNHHRLGVVYNYVVDKRLAELAGYKDAKDWAKKNLVDVSQATLTTYGAVADKFTEEIASRFGVTCLSLLLTYKEAAGVKVDHNEPGPTLIDVPDSKGVVKAKAFSACTVEEMRKALLAKRKPTSSKPVPAEDVALADQITKAAMSAFQKGDPVRIQVRNYQGETVLDFKGIPLAKWRKLVEALMADEALAALGQQDAPPKA